MHKNIRILGFILSGIPLLAYPIVLMASYMSLSAVLEYQDEGVFLQLVPISFLTLTLMYPLIYGVSLGGSLFVKSPQWKDRFVAIPYISLVLMVGLFFVWSGLE